MRAELGRTELRRPELGRVDLGRAEPERVTPTRADRLPVSLLRIAMPPRGNVDGPPGPIAASWRTADGEWHGESFDHLADLGGRFAALRVEVCPHPSDLAMTEVELPALPAKRRREAVLGAIELMTLDGVEGFAIGFGPRGVLGGVPVGWMSLDVLAEILQQLRGAGLAVDAVLPPPAFLPEPASTPDAASSSAPEPSRPGPNGALDGASAEAAKQMATAVHIGDWVVLRTGAAQGLLVPSPGRNPDGNGQAAIEQALRTRYPDLGAIRWVTGREALCGAGWPWSLPLASDRETGLSRRWAAPALGWTAAALAIGVAGLHLQAQRLAAEGRALSRQMSAEVKAAFPEVQVVLNPLQQARQMRDARRAGGIGGTGTAAPDVAAMLRSAAALLTQAQGQVQGIEAQDGQLRVRWRDGAAFGQAELRALQARAQQAGLSVEPDGHGLRIQIDATRSAAAEGRGAEVRTAQAPTSPALGATP